MKKSWIPLRSSYCKYSEICGILSRLPLCTLPCPIPAHPAQQKLTKAVGNDGAKLTVDFKMPPSIIATNVALDEEKLIIWSAVCCLGPSCLQKDPLKVLSKYHLWGLSIANFESVNLCAFCHVPSHYPCPGPPAHPWLTEGTDMFHLTFFLFFFVGQVVMGNYHTLEYWFVHWLVHTTVSDVWIL